MRNKHKAHTLTHTQKTTPNVNKLTNNGLYALLEMRYKMEIVRKMGRLCDSHSLFISFRILNMMRFLLHHICWHCHFVHIPRLIKAKISTNFVQFQLEYIIRIMRIPVTVNTLAWISIVINGSGLFVSLTFCRVFFLKLLCRQRAPHSTQTEKKWSNKIGK